MTGNELGVKGRCDAGFPAQMKTMFTNLKGEADEERF
jgi:hypothetical protein